MREATRDKRAWDVPVGYADTYFVILERGNLPGNEEKVTHSLA